jgi:hypothetical protein
MSGTINGTAITASSIVSGSFVSGAIVNADINTSADISQSKISGLTTALAAKADKASPTFSGIVGGISQSMVGLGNVNNTADSAKPLSNDMITALAAKADSSSLGLKADKASPTFSGIVGGISQSMVGLGNVNNTADSAKPLSTATIAALAAKADSSSLALKADKASPTFTGIVGGISQSMVGLGNVNNTADSAKPLSNDMITALAAKADSSSLSLKADKANPVFTGTVTAPTISITSGAAVTTTVSTGALQVTGGVGISGNVNCGGNIFLKTGSSVYVNGTVLSSGGGGGGGQTTTTIDFKTDTVFSSSTTNFYAIEIISNINTGIQAGDVYDPIEFFITGASIGSASLYNEVTLYGIIRPDGNTDHKLYYEFTQTQVTAGESRFYAIYTGTGTYKDIVIYARGGFIYSVTTNGTIGHYANKAGVISGITSPGLNGSGFNSGIKESDGTVALGMTSISTPNQSPIGNSLLNTDATMNTQIRNMGIMIKSNAASTSTSTGALVVAGGAGIAGSVYSGKIWAKASGDGQVLSLAGDGTSGGFIRFYQNGFATQSAFVGLGNNTNTFHISNQIVGNSINLNPDGSIIISPTASNWTTIGGGKVYCNSDVDALSYNARSDFRIKMNIIDMSGQSSLETLRSLKPSEYKLIANPKKSKVYGFVAQELKQTIPEAVSINPGFIPSIYEMAFIDNDKTKITLINKTTEDSWKRIKISDEEYDVADIIDDKTFRIKTEIKKEKIEPVDVSGTKLTLKQGVYKYKDTDEIYTGIVKDGVFVYGPEVPDFHSIDNNIIMTVTTRATQELDKQLQDARRRITTLENQILEQHETIKELTRDIKSIMSFINQ